MNNNTTFIKSGVEVGVITLDSVKDALNAWRLEKESPGKKIPKDLWVQIISLLNKHTEREIRFALNLTKTQLNRAKIFYQSPNDFEESSALPTKFLPEESMDFCEAEEEEATEKKISYPLAYKPAEAFATNTSVVELRRPDGMLMKIHICTDRFEELLQAFFKGSVK